MKRLLGALKLDITLQKRYGFYYAAAFITIVWITVLSSIPSSYLKLFVPFIIFVDLGVVGLFFIAGQILFEKSERTLSVLVTTPLTFAQYLASKVISMTILSIIISYIVVIVSYGLRFNYLLLTVGIITTSVICIMTGVIAVAPYSSISNFIIPSQLYLLIFAMPVFEYVGLLQSPLFYLIPTQGSLLLLKGGFTPIASWQVIYAIVYPAGWAYLLYRIARWRFDYYICLLYTSPSPRD